MSASLRACAETPAQAAADPSAASRMVRTRASVPAEAMSAIIRNGAASPECQQSGSAARRAKPAQPVEGDQPGPGPATVRGTRVRTTVNDSMLVKHMITAAAAGRRKAKGKVVAKARNDAASRLL